MSAALQLRASPNGPPFVGAPGDILVCQGGDEWAVETPSPLAGLTSPVYVELYLPAAGNDLKTAIKLAWAANPTATWFILPPGAWEWPSGSALTPADGLRSNLIMQGQMTTIFYDAHSLPTGQIIFFFSFTAGEMVDQLWRDIIFEHRNPVTGFASFSHDYEQPVRVKFINCTWRCTPDPSVTTGKGQWGAALLGGADCLIDDCQLFACQVAMGGAGRSALNQMCTNLQAHDCNDLVISIVTTGAGNSQKNTSVINVMCFGSRGSGAVFVGSDGGADPVGVLQNILVDGVLFTGNHADAIPRAPCAVSFAPGIVTEGVQFSHITHEQVTAIGGCRTILMADASPSSFKGLQISDVYAGVISSVTAEQIFIACTVDDVNIHDVICIGQRGLLFNDAANIVISNVITTDGKIGLSAELRNIDKVTIANCQLNDTAIFQPGLDFGSVSGKNFTNVNIIGCTLNGLSFALRTALNGGTMDMTVSATVLSPVGVTPETLAGITTATNVQGLV